MTEEIWRDIPGFGGVYQASTLGRVKRVSQQYSDKTTKGGRKMKGLFYPEKIMRGDIGNYGKTRYHLVKNNIRKKYMGHILVAQTFPEICGEWYKGCEVHHKDVNPSNNSPYNLVCLTPEEHQTIHTNMGYMRGENNPFFGKHHPDYLIKQIADKICKPINQLSINGEVIKKWRSCTDAARELSLDKSSINRCCLGKQHTSGGYRWEYA